MQKLFFWRVECLVRSRGVLTVHPKQKNFYQTITIIIAFVLEMKEFLPIRMNFPIITFKVFRDCTKDKMNLLIWKNNKSIINTYI